MSALDAALAAINEASAGASGKSLIAAKCRGLMRGYDARWASEQQPVTAAERTVTTELINIQTGRASRTFKIAGKLDANCGPVLIDHKTTSEDIGPESAYWQQLRVESQVSHYMLLEWAHGRKVEHAVWDVIKKPGIAPKALSKANVKEISADGEYFGWPLSADDHEALAATGRETLSMYEARLVHDCTVERPDRYFQRRTIPRLDNEIYDYAVELWNNAQELISARASNRHGKNPAACMMFGRPCKFLGICSGHDTPDSAKWTKKKNVHAEIDVDGDGRDVLTNSRMKVFLTCRYKHYLQYELGIDRVGDEEESEALYFGSLMHLALEAWMKFFMTKETVTNEYSDGPKAIPAAITSTSNETTLVYF